MQYFNIRGNSKGGIMKKYILLLLVFVLLFSISCTKKTDEVRLGVVLPLTGNISEFGEPMLNGIRLAVDQYNNAGNTPKIHLFIYDGKGDIHVTNNRIKDLISDKVIAIIGPITSATVMNSSILTQKKGIVQIAPAATHVLATKYSRSIWRICYTDDDQGSIMAHFAKSLNLKNAFVIIDTTNVYSKGLSMYFKNAFEYLNGKISKNYYVNGENFNITDIANSIKLSKADFVFIPMYYEMSYKIIRELRKNNITIPILGGDGWDSPELYKKDFSLPGKNYFCDHFFYKTNDNMAKDFVNNYEKRYKTIPSSMSALGYDAASLLITEIKDNNAYDRSALLTAMVNLKSFYGVTGNMTFNKTPDPHKGFYIIEISDKGAKLNSQLQSI